MYQVVTLARIDLLKNTMFKNCKRNVKVYLGNVLQRQLTWNRKIPS